MLTLTRETKAGLVVAGSFLCLVAVVVLARLRNSDTPSGEQTAPEQTASAEAKTPSPEPPKPQPVTQMPELQPAPPSPGGQVVQTSGATAEPPKTTFPEPLIPLVRPDAVPRDPQPSPVEPPPLVGFTPPVSPETQPTIQPPTVVAPPSMTPHAPALDLSPPKTENTAPIIPPPLALPGGNSIPTPVSTPLPVTDTVPKKEAGKERPITKPTHPKLDTPEPVPMPLPEVPAPRVEPAKPPTPRPDTTLPSVEPITSVVPVSRPSKAPEAESWPEDIISWKETDSFKSISKKHYLTEAYGLAIYEYNRNHNRVAQGLRKDPPFLSPGEKLFLPPIAILEREYPAAISNRTNPEPTPTPVASTTAVPGKERYRVRAGGEMYWDIAKRTGANWMDIYLLNGKRFPSEQPIPAGTVLTMPANARVPAENRP